MHEIPLEELTNISVIAAAMIGIITLVVAIGNLVLNRKNSKATQERYNESMSSFISLEKIVGYPVLESVSLAVKNTGKTPARNVRIKTRDRINFSSQLEDEKKQNDESNKVYETFKKFCIIDFSEEHEETFISYIAPNESMKFPFLIDEYFKDLSDSQGIKEIVFDVEYEDAFLGKKTETINIDISDSLRTPMKQKDPLNNLNGINKSLNKISTYIKNL